MCGTGNTLRHFYHISIQHSKIIKKRLKPHHNTVLSLFGLLYVSKIESEEKLLSLFCFTYQVNVIDDIQVETFHNREGTIDVFVCEEQFRIMDIKADDSTASMACCFFKEDSDRIWIT